MMIGEYTGPHTGTQSRWWSSVLCGLLLLAGCSGGDHASAPVDDPIAPSAQTIYSVANGCYLLKTDAGYVAADAVDVAPRMEPTRQTATAFRFQATALGAYLLLSDYTRATGSMGTKTLLGISDPAGEWLDELGQFVGQVGEAQQLGRHGLGGVEPEHHQDVAPQLLVQPPPLPGVLGLSVLPSLGKQVVE